MPLNVLGGNKVYTTTEVDALIACASSFSVVDRLPALSVAKLNTVYYKKTDNTYDETVGYHKNGDPTDISETADDTHTIPIIEQRPVLVPYVACIRDNTKVWCTSGGASTASHTAITDPEIQETWDSVTDTSKYTLLKTDKILAKKEVNS